MDVEGDGNLMNLDVKINSIYWGKRLHLYCVEMLV